MPSDLDEAQLEAASDAVGAISFARPEDGAFNKRNPNEFFFVTDRRRCRRRTCSVACTRSDSIRAT